LTITRGADRVNAARIDRIKITDPAQARAAVRRAADHVLSTGLPALVDVVCRPR
jgi:hypothetical protein